jgi:hypothetical protein
MPLRSLSRVQSTSDLIDVVRYSDSHYRNYTLLPEQSSLSVPNTGPSDHIETNHETDTEAYR